VSFDHEAALACHYRDQSAKEYWHPVNEERKTSKNFRLFSLKNNNSGIFFPDDEMIADTGRVFVIPPELKN